MITAIHRVLRTPRTGSSKKPLRAVPHTAPKVFRALGIEWVWRLFKEPGRMWKRYIIGNPLFVYRIFRHGKNRPSTGTAGGKNT